MKKHILEKAPYFFAVLKSVGTKATGYVSGAEGPFRCGHCRFYKDGFCGNAAVKADKASPHNDAGNVVVSPQDCCNEYEPAKAEKAIMKPDYKKFIPFVKVDEPKREVSGIVTAEVPDKEDEVCDYAKTKPLYQNVIAEMTKATGGENFFPLREMHQLSAVGKCIGFEFRDGEKEILMTFKVVDDDAWKKVKEKVYTGFSQGGKLVGDLVPDPIFKGCMRYVADPTECSLVDNPCLGVAHFTHIKADGAVEICKVRSEPLPGQKVEAKKAKPSKEVRLKACREFVRKRCRIWVNKHSRKVYSKQPFMNLDNDLAILGKGTVKKGMYEVSSLAYLIEEMMYLFFQVVNEQEWENDSESELPSMLSSNLTGLIDSLLAMVSEETGELKEHVAARLGAEAATAS